MASGKLGRQVLVVLCLLLAGFTSSTQALVIDITLFDPGERRLNALMTEIVNIDDRVYTLDLVSGEVIFGDGQPGARPPTGQDNVVGSYRHGLSLDGTIVNLYPIQSTNLPLLIPISDFVDTSGREDLSFIIAGFISIEFEFSLNGLTITGAQTGPSGVPEPTALALLGLAGIGFRRRRRY